jgi:L-fuculose-phosphate aldolase
MRVPDQPDRFVVKGRGYAMDRLAVMRPEHMVVCDLDGEFISGPPNSSQCGEVKMHSAIYKLYPNILSVVHVHPPHVQLLTALGASLKPLSLEGTHLFRHPLPLYPHVRTIQTEDEGMECARLLGDHKAVLLLGHGAVTAGSSVKETVTNMRVLEEQARMNWQAYCAVGDGYTGLTDALMDEMDNRIPLNDLPHFLGRRPPTQGGEWEYLSALVSEDL